MAGYMYSGPRKGEISSAVPTPIQILYTMTQSPLLQALSLEQGSRNEFTATIAQDWTTQHSVLGGFLNALMLAATQKYLEAEFGPGRYPDPIHVFVQFLSVVPPGPVTVSCHLLRKSSRQCVMRVEVVRVSKKSSEPQATTTAIVTYGDLSKEKGVTQGSDPALSIGMPNRETECVPIDDPVVDATPVTRRLHWIAPRGANGLWGHRIGGHNREVWLSARDGSKWSSLLHLAMLADMPLQPPATHEQGFYTRNALSTLCLSVEFKERPHPDTQWVMTRSNSTKVSNGRYDVNLEILDESGRILALSHHVVYIFPLTIQPGPKL